MELSTIPKLSDHAPRRYVSSAPKDGGGDYMATGSENVMLSGTGKTQVFKGVTSLSPKTGGIVMMNVAEDFASLGQASDITAYGNAFNVFSALFYIGKGLLKLAGASLLVNASATLSLLLKRNGSYTDPLSGPWQAGLAQPSAPTIQAVTPPAGFTGKVNGVVSVVIWRIRSTTGAVSIHSEVSNIVSAANQSIAVALPLPDANGQDYWGIGVTQNEEGTTGSHFELTEVPESQVAESVTRTDVVTNAASLDITSATAGFTSSMIGWTVVLSGGTPATTLTTYVTAVPAANTLTLAAMPPTTSTGVHMVLSRGVGGTARSVVIEWRDGDLVGKELAPTRAFPPPEGLFAGSLEDVTFVDGCYADGEAITSDSNRGSAIAPSEPGKPESFSPDNVIFTNDTPTALLRGDGVYWRLCRNSGYVIRYLGGDKPLSVEPVWEGTGVLYQHNAVLGEGGRLYLWPTRLSPMRLGADGLLEGTFANDIADDLINCIDPAKRITGWFGDKHVVIFAYEKKVWCYFADLSSWAAPINLTGIISGNVKSTVTVNGAMYLSDDADNLYNFDVGTGSTAKVRTPWITSQRAMDTIAAVIASIRADNTATDVIIDIFCDGDEVTPASTFTLTPTRTGFQRTPAIWPNLTDTEEFQLQITMTSTTATGDAGLERLEAFGPSHEILR
jgi:hypothetical protein